MIKSKRIAFASMLIVTTAAKAEILYETPVPPFSPSLANVSLLPLNQVEFKEKDGNLELNYELPLDLTGGVLKKMSFVSKGFPDPDGTLNMTSLTDGTAQCTRAQDGYRCGMHYDPDTLGQTVKLDTIKKYLQDTVSDPVLLSDKIDIAAYFTHDARGVIRGLTLPSTPAVTGCALAERARICSFSSLPDVFTNTENAILDTGSAYWYRAPNVNTSQRSFHDLRIAWSCYANGLISDSHWTQVKISNSDFVGSNLTRNNWDDVSMYNVDARRSMLAASNFKNTTIAESCLAQANLSGSNFDGTVSFRGSDLRGAQLSGITINGTVDWTDAKLGGAVWMDGRVCAESSVGSCD